MFRTILLVMIALAASVFGQQAGGQRLYVVTYIDVFPMYAADTVKILQELANNSKKDAGFVRFEVLKDVARANHMTIVEVWQNRDAYEKHLMAEHTKQFRTKIQPWLGSPFDDRMYNLVE